MSNSEILIFKTSKINSPPKIAKSELRIWKPTVSSVKPKQKPMKYILYWVFNYFGIFTNPSYCQVVLVLNEIQIASMLVIPAHFKYPFMKKNDVQFTYVMTKPEYRGKGVAWSMIYMASKKFTGDLWYVTNHGNKSSIRLANKMGFEYVCNGKKSTIFNIIKPQVPTYGI